MSKISIISYIVTIKSLSQCDRKSEWCLCVPCKQFKEAMLIHPFNYVYNDCKQLLNFSWREKRNTEDNNDLGQ